MTDIDNADALRNGGEFYWTIRMADGASVLVLVDRIEVVDGGDLMMWGDDDDVLGCVSAGAWTSYWATAAVGLQPMAVRRWTEAPG